MEHDEADRQTTLIPVSYTHLDVYKRQDYIGARATRKRCDSFGGAKESDNKLKEDTLL